jgi:hypothetical protein
MAGLRALQYLLLPCAKSTGQRAPAYQAALSETK